jgi:tetratricopeptide (TPR) repeat protein
VIALLLLATLAAGPQSAELKRARDRFESGAYDDARAMARAWLAANPDARGDDAVEAYRIIGTSELKLGHEAEARQAFQELLLKDPDYGLDPFLVEPRVVEFFDAVKRASEPELAPLRAQRRAEREQARAAEEAARAPRVVRVRERLYLLNWMPLGAGQYQNGDRAKGTAIAAAEVAFAAVNLGAILFHNQIAEDRGRRCSTTQPTGCSRPPYTDSDRRLLSRTDTVKYVSAGLFWAVYGYGVIDAHLHYVPRVETELSPKEAGAILKLSWKF